MIEKNNLTIQKELLSRRSWLMKGFKTATALGLGALAHNSTGSFNPFVVSAMEKMTTGDFDGDGKPMLPCGAKPTARFISRAVRTAHFQPLTGA